MTERFDNVSVSLRANVYFDGRVSSRSVFFPDGTRKTLGVILPGTFEFDVANKEIVTLLRGNAEVLLPPEKKEWVKVTEGDSFTVIADSTYVIRCCEVVEYACNYISGN